MKKNAFTMIELVFVIVVLGILSSLALPRLDRDVRQEAIDNVLAAIQLTQHLALVDDKTDPSNGLWQKELWTLRFTADGSGSFVYSVFSDLDHDGIPTQDEAAMDPATNGYIFDDGDGDVGTGESKSAFLKYYGVNNIAYSNSCPADHISFDRFGRLFGVGAAGTTPAPFDEYVASACTITLSFEDGAPANIVIEAETGYARVI